MVTRSVVVSLAVLLVLASCSSEPDPVTPEESGSEPVSTAQEPALPDAEPVASGEGAPLTPPSTGPEPEDETPEQVFSKLEARLLALDAFTIQHEITATGAVIADVIGDTEFREGASLEMTTRGTFGGQPVDYRLASDGAVLDILGGKGARQIPTPPELHEALILGLSRMGLLHNIAVLTGSRPPDHSEGGVAKWVVVKNVALGKTRMVSGQLARSYTFDVIVSGTPAASATLWVAADNGLPIERHQTVKFPDGEMKVVERYRFTTPDS